MQIATDYRLSFETERAWAEEEVKRYGSAIYCAIRAEKARVIDAALRDGAGEIHKIVITCVPHMKREDMAAAVSEAVFERKT